MKRLLILNTYPSGGGAAQMARRTLEGLRAMGVDARMLVAAPLAETVAQSPKLTSDYIQSVGGKIWQPLRYLEKLETLYYLRGNRKNLFRFSTSSMGLSGLFDHPWVEWAEVINLHWVQQSFLSISGLEVLLKLPHKKFVWTLHDFWPITGGCHSPYEIKERGVTQICTRFQSGCGRCPLLSGIRLGRQEDISAQLFRRKAGLHSDNLTLHTISLKADNVVRRSPIGRSKECYFLPNFFDAHTFSPAPYKPRTKRILFVAATLDDPVKGLDLAKNALKIATQISPELQRDYVFTVVGNVKRSESLQGFPIKVEQIPLQSHEELSKLYRASALTLSTSRMETFGLTLLESIACGTPVISFDVDGPSTFIKDGVNGMLIPPFDTKSMAQGILKLTVLDAFSGKSPYEISATVDHFREEIVLSSYVKAFLTNP